jgi:hypothetical protein
MTTGGEAGVSGAYPKWVALTGQNQVSLIIQQTGSL